MDTLKDWLENKYLDWQKAHGLISLRKWSDVLGISYSHLMGMISGDRTGTTMQTAYAIGEKLNDFSILGILGYPVPDAQSDADLQRVFARASPVDNARL